MTRASSSESALERAAKLHGVTAADLTELGAFESDVYSFDGPSGPGILKVMAPGHRSLEQVQAEVDWLLSLAESAAPVAPPLRDVTGAWVRELEPLGEVIVAYQRVAGKLTKPADWSHDLITAWGEVLGRLQAHSRSWSPPGPRRRSLLEASHVGALGAFEATDPAFHAAAKALLEDVTPLLDGSGDAGLVHADLHHGNVLLHEGRWTAIDFDDCGYASYALDLAMPVYYAVRSQRDLRPERAAERFIPPFMRGLRRWTRDPEVSVEDLEAILRFRQVELVIALTHEFAAEKITPALRDVAADLRERVVAGAQFLPHDVLKRCLE